MQETQSIKIARSKAENALRAMGYTLSPDKNEYVAWRGLKNGVSVIYYTSGKLVIQGKSGVDSVVEELLGKQSDHEEYIPHMGADEVGKGDYFGPLVVVACYVSERNYPEVLKIGARDSKSMKDEKIIDLVNKLEKFVEYKVKVISPSQYNEDVSKVGNISILLSQYHMENVRDLMSKLEEKGIKCNKVVIDQFSKRKDRLEKEADGLELTQFHKGESDVVVAVASMIARKTFLEEMEDMKSKYGFDFPRGASDVIPAVQAFVTDFSEKELSDVAKVSFKTTQKALFSLSS